jgi:hypothetical protein
MEPYPAAVSFLEKQIRDLGTPFKLDDRELTDALAGKPGKGKVTRQQLVQALVKVSERRDAYYQKVFSQQATRHVAMEVISSLEKKTAEARQRILSQESALFVRANPEIGDAIVSMDRIRAMPVTEMVNLAEILTQAHGDMDRVSRALARYRTAHARNRATRDKLDMVLRVLGKYPAQAVHNNAVVSTRAPVLDEINRLRSLVGRVQSKIQANPQSFKMLLDEPNLKKRNATDVDEVNTGRKRLTTKH